MTKCSSFLIFLSFVVITKASLNFCINEVVTRGRSCFVSSSVLIGTKNYEIEDKSSEEVQSIDFQAKKNVRFLPIEVYRKFPNLEAYIAERCNVSEIVQANFEDLFHLRELNLRGNKIETMRRDTFMFLVSVRKIYLSM